MKSGATWRWGNAQTCCACCRTFAQREAGEKLCVVGTVSREEHRYSQRQRERKRAGRLTAFSRQRWQSTDCNFHGRGWLCGRGVMVHLQGMCELL